MNRLTLSAAAATAAAALSGGGVMALSAGGEPRQAGQAWKAIATIGERPVGSREVATMRHQRLATVWAGGSHLSEAAASSNGVRPVEATTGFVVAVPVEDPSLIDRGGVAITLRFHVERRNGWVQGRIDAEAVGGGEQSAILGGDGRQQWITLFVPAERIRSFGRAEVRGELHVAARRGEGSLRLDSVEVAT